MRSLLRVNTTFIRSRSMLHTELCEVVQTDSKYAVTLVSGEARRLPLGLFE